MALRFVNLHGHTSASVYDALGTPKDYAEWMIKNAGEDSGAFAITNHGNMNDIGYQVAAQKDYDKKGAPVKMIYGVEAYFLPDLAEWRKLKDETDAQKKEDKKKPKEEIGLVIENEEESKNKKYFNPLNRRNHMVVCAANQAGLSNLFRLVSRSYRQGFYRKPRIDINMLRDCNEGLIVSTACIHPDAVIRTSFGDMRMEDLVKRVEDGNEIFVLGVKELNETPVFEKVTWAKKTRKDAKLFKIKLKNGKELKLTPDHRVYTNRGWVEAQNLKKTDKILGMPPTFF